MDENKPESSIDIAALSKPEAIHIARQILQVAYSYSNQPSHVRIWNAGGGSLRVEASGIDGVELTPTDEVRIEPVIFEPTGESTSAPMVYLSHALTVSVRNDYADEGLVGIDLSRMPSNRAGALSFLLERRVPESQVSLVGLGQGARHEVKLSPGAEIRLVGMGYSLTLMTPQSTRREDGKHEETL